MKKCNKCLKMLDLAEFYYVATTKRHSTHCRSCILAKRKAQAKKLSNARKQYYHKNVEKQREYARNYYNNNKEYREKRLEQFKEASRQRHKEEKLKPKAQKMLAFTSLSSPNFPRDPISLDQFLEGKFLRYADVKAGRQERGLD